MKKLSKTGCRVIPQKETLEDYNKSQIYKDIARRYGNDAKRKDLVYFAADSTLCSKLFSEPSTSR